jgi:hypothetical protein
MRIEKYMFSCFNTWRFITAIAKLYSETTGMEFGYPQTKSNSIHLS